MNLKNYKVNVSIDDVSPHPKSSIKVLDRCYELIEEFKDGKVKNSLIKEKLDNYGQNILNNVIKELKKYINNYR